MYFCYNLEKEEGSLKTELKNCLSLYKILYSCAFILILCAIHPIIYYEDVYKRQGDSVYLGQAGTTMYPASPRADSVIYKKAEKI